MLVQYEIPQRNKRNDCGVIPLPEKRPKSNWMQVVGKVGVVSTDMLVFFGIGFWVGQEVDSRLDSVPWGTFAGAAGGFVMGLWSIVRRVSDWK